jgi:hypothetical protein
MRSTLALTLKVLDAYISISSFDVDLPLECDDEYWEHPNPDMAFKQPPGKPSVIAYFNSYLKLNQVLAFSLRTIVRWLISYLEDLTSHFLGPVFNQQIEGSSRFCGTAMGAPYRYRAGLRVEQMDRFCSRPSCASYYVSL